MIRIEENNLYADIINNNLIMPHGLKVSKLISITQYYANISTDVI